VILVDANILLYAEDSLSDQHEQARSWWDLQLSGSAPVALCWPVLTAFIRIGTNARLHERPLRLAEAVARIQSWMAQPCVRLIGPTEQHWTILQELLRKTGATGNLVSDAHLAALAIEHNCELHSSDQDFARFDTLKWSNPLAVD
jgi:hypothetical protein